MDEMGNGRLKHLKLGRIGGILSVGGETWSNIINYQQGDIDGYELLTKTGITGSAFAIGNKVGSRYGGFIGIAAGQAISNTMPRAEAGLRLTIMNSRTGFNHFINSVTKSVFSY